MHFDYDPLFSVPIIVGVAVSINPKLWSEAKWFNDFTEPLFELGAKGGQLAFSPKTLTRRCQFLPMSLAENNPLT